MIELRNLSYAIAGTPILENISATIPKGRVTAIIGPNGAGKSSLMGLMTGLIKPLAGSIHVDGVDVFAMDRTELALKMALVSQDSGVATRLRVADFVAFGRWPHHQGRPRDEDCKCLRDAMAKFELTDIAARFMDEISGGQKQRAFVAMAYVQDTDWLLLDEPLNNLDIRYAGALMRKLKALAHQDGKGIPVVIHDLNYAISNADYVIALKDGCLQFEGLAADVMTADNLSKLYDTNVTVSDVNGRGFVQHYV